MPSHALSGLLPVALCLLSGTLLAHGGQYVGPTTGGSPPAPRGPVTPGAPVLGGPTTGGQANLDINNWRVWWQLNHRRFVRGGGSQLTDAERRDIVLPTLRLALSTTKSPDVQSASLVALGKAAVEHPEWDVLDILREQLPSAHLEVRESAVLAMGLSGRPDAIVDLGALLGDSRTGRRLISRARVGDRVRTFAAYALGVLAQRTTSAAVKALVLQSLVEALENSRIKDRDLQVAVLNAIRMIAPEPSRGAAHKRVLWMAMAALEAHQKKRVSARLAAVRSHGLTAMARLARRGGDTERRRARVLAADVLERRGSVEAEHYVSAVIALGEVVEPTDEAELALLLQHVKRPRDSLVPKFAMIALGQIGGNDAFETLRDALRTGKRGLKPWAALGLGLLALHDRTAPTPKTPATTQGRKRDWPAEVGELLRDRLAAENSRDLRAAIAIGLGLAGDSAAAPTLRALVDEFKATEDAAGLVCVSLAMLDDKPSIPLVRAAMSTIQRPVRFGQAALALAKFGQRDASAGAVAALSANNLMGPGYLTRLAAAVQAIGYLQNPTDMAALVDLLPRDERRRSRLSAGDLRVAFAAAALGSVADRDDLGFGTRIAHGMNYTGLETTISNGQNGILDIF